jgi:hypothetical protein
LTATSSRGSSARGPRGVGGAILNRRTLLALAGLGAVAACTGEGQGAAIPPSASGTTPTAASTPSSSAPATTGTPPAGQLYYGAATKDGNLSAFEGELGETLSCYRSFFKSWETEHLLARAQEDLAAGRVPLVSIKPPASWAETARDQAWLDGLTGPLSALDGPVYLIINHEPENDAHQFGTPADYVALQDAALASADAAGGNVTVVPILSTWSFDDRAGRNPKAWNVRDAPIYGVDLYNPWAPGMEHPWVPFEEKLGLAEQEAAGRPVLVGEYGCRSDPARPGRAATWLRKAFANALKENVVAMAYFDSDVGATDGSWELDAETLPVFAELLARQQVARV